MNENSRPLKFTGSFLFLIVAILIGGYIRLFQVLQAPLPLGDGGMFFSMTQDLIDNRFHLPAFISYNQLNVPNTYPPLAFYMAGFISVFARLNLINVFRIFPAIFSILSIPAFYLFAREIIRNESQLSIAVLIFALVPPSFNWLIKGGGIARSPAFLFSILALTFIYRLYTQKKRVNIIFASIFSALTLLIHPQITLFTACSAVVFFLFLSRNKEGVIKSLVVAGLTLLLSAPWWLSMIMRYGFAPFINAFATGGYSGFSIVRYFFGNTLSEFGPTSIIVFGLIGIFLYLYEKEYFLPTWALVSTIIDPRSTPRNLILALTICASYALLRLFRQLSQKKDKKLDHDSNVLSGILPKIMLLILFGQWVFSALYTVNNIANNYSLNEDDIAAVEWMKKNTNPKSNFLVLSGMIPFDDPFSEWLPSLTDRASLATVQGKEWDTGIDFAEAVEDFKAAQSCYLKSADCIKDWEEKFKENIDYIYIRENNDLADPDEGLYSSAITKALLSSNQYDLTFENDLVAILKKR